MTKGMRWSDDQTFVFAHLLIGGAWGHAQYQGQIGQRRMFSCCFSSSLWLTCSRWNGRFARKFTQSPSEPASTSTRMEPKTVTGLDILIFFRGYQWREGGRGMWVWPWYVWKHWGGRRDQHAGSPTRWTNYIYIIYIHTSLLHLNWLWVLL